MKQALKLALIIAIGTAAACASGGTRPTGARHNLVTAEELSRLGNVTLYDALRQVRPAFLRTRQPETQFMPETPINVYLGGLFVPDGLEYLRQIMAHTVQQVEFLEPQQANARFGTNNNGGALIIAVKQ